MTREEALNTFLGNLYKNEPIDRESAQFVADGLMDILSHNHKKDLDVFGLKPFPRLKSLNDFIVKRPVGRPKLGLWRKAYKDVATREENYRPIHEEIIKRFKRRKNEAISLDRVISFVAKDFGVSHSYAKKAYYSIKSCYRN